MQLLKNVQITHWKAGKRKQRNKNQRKQNTEKENGKQQQQKNAD